MLLDYGAALRGGAVAEIVYRGKSLLAEQILHLIQYQYRVRLHVDRPDADSLQPLFNRCVHQPRKNFFGEYQHSHENGSSKPFGLLARTFLASLRAVGNDPPKRMRVCFVGGSKAPSSKTFVVPSISKDQACSCRYMISRDFGVWPPMRAFRRWWRNERRTEKALGCPDES